MMVYTKIFNEKQRSPAFVCHPTSLPYLREKVFTKFTLNAWRKQTNKNQQNTDVNIRESLCCYRVKYRIVFSNLLKIEFVKGKKRMTIKITLVQNIFWVAKGGILM